MSRKSNFDPEIRGFYFASSGTDDEDGQTLERPKKTAQAAIDATGDLIPVPDLTNQAQVFAAQGGAFSEGFILPGFVNFDATNAIFDANQAVSITMGNGQNCRINGLRNSQNNSTCFLIDGKSLVGTISLFCLVAGDDSIGYEIKGTNTGIFSTCDRLTILGARSIGVKITGTFTDPIDKDFDVVLLEGDDAVYVDYNPDNAIDACAINVSSVFSVGATVTSRGTSSSTAYIARSGHLTIKGLVLIADTAIEVKPGARVDLRQETVIGNIIVDSGGVLNVDILQHIDGTITNNGTINGIINGVPFGNYQQKHQEQSVLNASDFTTQNPTGTDAPRRILFGSAQFGSSDPVELDAAGNITINQSDQYNVRIILHFGREGAGAFSLLIFRLLINGVQLGNSVYAQISTSQTAFPIEFSGPINFVATDVLTVELIRDGSAFDDGGLSPLTPNLGSVNPAASAQIMMRRNRLVQPV